MPVGNIWNVEWLDSNSLRKYPLAESASLQDVSGQLTIPNDFIIDARICVPWNIDITQFHIASLGVYTFGVTITLAYNGVAFKTILIPSNTVKYSVFQFSTSTASGYLTIGSMLTILQQLGAYNFTVDSAAFCPSSVTPMFGGVTAVYIDNGGQISGPYTGEFTFTAGQNIHLTATNTGMKVDAVCFDDYSTCDCPDKRIKDPIEQKFVKTINAVVPNSAGNIDLVGTDCLAVKPLPGQAQIELDDVCSKTCCGCAELTVLQSTYSTLVSDFSTMMSSIKSLETASNQILTSAIFSRSRI